MIILSPGSRVRHIFKPRSITASLNYMAAFIVLRCIGELWDLSLNGFTPFNWS